MFACEIAHNWTLTDKVHVHLQSYQNYSQKILRYSFSACFLIVGLDLFPWFGSPAFRSQRDFVFRDSRQGKTVIASRNDRRTYKRAMGNDLFNSDTSKPQIVKINQHNL